jgi:formylmethanofuran dehydrogenase subunit B
MRTARGEHVVANLQRHACPKRQAWHPVYQFSFNKAVVQFEFQMPQTFTDVACTLCGCVCDDLQVDVADGSVTAARGTCPISEPWFASLAKPSHRPIALIDGTATPLSTAIDRAADILQSSHAPLVWGLVRSSTAGHRAAIGLAEQLGGTIDPATSCDPAATLAVQHVGQSTCSLGELRNRADLVLFWFANPIVTHPRHLERYSVEPRGLFVPRGRADRMVVCVDSAPTETGEFADAFLRIAPESEVAAIEALSKLVRNEDIGEMPFDADLLERLRQLATQMKSCQYGALLFGTAREGANTSTATIESLLKLTSALNHFTRFTAHYLAASGGMLGAENVLTWQTGFPFAVNFATGYPRYDPQTFAAEGLLERGEVDACVLVGSQAVRNLSPAAQANLKKIPTISLDDPNAELGASATVQFTTAIYGIHVAGTAYRMDGVSIPLRKLLPTDYPSDDEVLNRIAARLKS